MEEPRVTGPEEQAELETSEIEYVSYGGEHHLPLIMSLVDDELSEPYSIFTYRYFVYLWPHLSFLVSFVHLYCVCLCMHRIRIGVCNCVHLMMLIYPE